MSTSAGVEKVRDWILGRHAEREHLDFEENLIETRLVDSLSFIELIYVIESASGAEIDFDSINLDDFQTLTAIDKAFFTKEAAV
jgi:acyl carrier protein